MIGVELEKDKVLVISASNNLVKSLSFHCQRLQCVVPNTINFFNEDFIEQIQFVLLEAGNITRTKSFCLSDEKAEKLLSSVVQLRGSVLACSSCIRMNFYESFDFVFNVLIRMLNKRKSILENFSLESYQQEVETQEEFCI